MVTIKSFLFCDIMPCSLVEVYWHSRGTYCFCLQGERLNWASKLSIWCHIPNDSNQCHENHRSHKMQMTNKMPFPRIPTAASLYEGSSLVPDPMKCIWLLQESIKKLEITKDGTIESLQLEKQQISGQLSKQKEKIQSLEDELKQVRCEGSWRR